MARKSGFVRRNGVMRRETMWLGATFTVNTLASTNAVALTASLDTAELALRPFTVVRVRGGMHVRSDQTGASEAFGVQMGLCVVSDQAVAIGVTAVPTPDTDQASDAWFVYEQYLSRFEFISGVGVDTDSGRYVPYDSKAMRKVEDGFDVIQVIECPSTSAQVSDAFRMLIKLH